MISGLVGAIVTLLGILFFKNKQGVVNKALSDNVAMQNKLNEADKAILENQAKIAKEEGRVDILQKEQVQNVSQEDLVKFVNSIKPKQ